jgi:DNA-binding MarR family transcriptional regulator
MSADLYREIRQTKPFRTLEEEVYVALRLTAQLLEEPWARFLRQERISPSQYNLLRILRGAGVEGRTMSEIAERMINRDPDATRLADRTIQMGLVRRVRDDQDRRVVRLFITPAGLDLLARLDDCVDLFLKQALAGLKPKQLATLRDLLGAARAGRKPFPIPEPSP